MSNLRKIATTILYPGFIMPDQATAIEIAAEFQEIDPDTKYQVSSIFVPDN